jgi:hypothetical protein
LPATEHYTHYQITDKHMASETSHVVNVVVWIFELAGMVLMAEKKIPQSPEYTGFFRFGDLLRYYRR